MTRSIVSISRLASSIGCVVLAIGCGGTVTSNTVATAPSTPAIAKAALAGKQVSRESSATAVKASGISERAVGDFVVFRFSGTFRKGSITLTERVVAKEGAVIVVDYTMVETTPSAPKNEKGAITKEQTLRAKIDTTVGSRGEVFGVQKIEKGRWVVVKGGLMF